MLEQSGQENGKDPVITRHDPLPPVIRTFAGMRGALFDEMDRLRNSTTDPKTANAIARLGTTIVMSVKMELEAARIIKEGSDQDLTLPLLPGKQ